MCRKNETRLKEGIGKLHFEQPCFFDGNSRCVGFSVCVSPLGRLCLVKGKMQRLKHSVSVCLMDCSVACVTSYAKKAKTRLDTFPCCNVTIENDMLILVMIELVCLVRMWAITVNGGGNHLGAVFGLWIFQLNYASILHALIFMRGVERFALVGFRFLPEL